MENIGKSDTGTRLDLTQVESFEAFSLAPVHTENLAERIAAVLDERRRIGEERRWRGQKHLFLKTKCAEVEEGRRGESKGSDHRVRELDALCEAVSSSNAAIEAMKEHAKLDTVEDANGTKRREPYGLPRI
jgi:hypothetical protein